MENTVNGAINQANPEAESAMSVTRCDSGEIKTPEPSMDEIPHSCCGCGCGNCACTVCRCPHRQ